MQSRAARLGLVAAVVVVAIVVFIVLKSNNSDKSNDTAKGVQTLRVDSSGNPVGGVKTLTYNKGDQVQLHVILASPEEAVHVHGYESRSPRRGARSTSRSRRSSMGSSRSRCTASTTRRGRSRTSTSTRDQSAQTEAGDRARDFEPDRRASLPGRRLGARAGRTQGLAGPGLALRLGGVACPDHLLRAALGRLDHGAAAEGGVAGDAPLVLRCRAQPGDPGDLRARRRLPALCGALRRLQGDRGPDSQLLDHLRLLHLLARHGRAQRPARGCLSRLQSMARDRPGGLGRLPFGCARIRPGTVQISGGAGPLAGGARCSPLRLAGVDRGRGNRAHAAQGCGRDRDLYGRSRSSAWLCSGSRNGLAEARRSTRISGCSPSSDRSRGAWTRSDGGSS